MPEDMETKQLSGFVTETKKEDRNGVPVGLIRGYIATWDKDRGDDRFVKGAFRDSIEDHKRRDRPIRFKDNHGRTVGGFPIDGVFEDDKGLFGTAEVNLEVQQGRELFSLVKQKVISDFSIGFGTQEFEITDSTRIIQKAIIWEGSAVDEPMNTEANIVSFKSATPFKDLPLADRDRPWNAPSAAGRVKQFTDSTDTPGERYKNGFLWFDRTNKEDFGAYKLPFADVVGGKLVAVPRGIFAAAAAMQGADIPSGDRAAVERHINRYYDKLDMESPFEKSGLGISELETMDAKELEAYLKSLNIFSRTACTAMASRFAKGQSESDEGNQSESGSAYISELKKLTETLKN